MSAPFLTFLNIPTPLQQDDFNTHNEHNHQLASSSSTSTTTTYVAIVSRHGKTFTKVLNPSSITTNTSDGSLSSTLRGRKRALSGGGNTSAFFNPLSLKQSSSLQKRTKFLLFSWSTSSKRNNSIEEQERRRSSNELTTLTTTGNIKPQGGRKEKKERNFVFYTLFYS